MEQWHKEAGRRRENSVDLLLTGRGACDMIVSPLLQVYFFVPIFRHGLQLSREAEQTVKWRCRRQMRVKITLACTECKQRNYNTKKNKKNSPDRLEMKKYCRFCKKHTVHRETK